MRLLPQINHSTQQQNNATDHIDPKFNPKQFLQSEQTNDSGIEIENDQETSDTTNLEENLYHEDHTTPEREPKIKDQLAFDFTNLKVTQLLGPPRLIID
ncbi:unnamed protein product [Rotaria magnacalcarata]